uniref:Putative E3 ubiquitin-protein ligase LIN N-terminal domain-containing protein n=1 Tax=Ananas comosus var. bracteatus TaxID=296719 RepID=A0A6V7QCC7_ANACO|nr:unnamed protein product [Ananas comosus var. bracteatus]
MTWDQTKFKSIEMKDGGFVTFGDNTRGKIIGIGTIVGLAATAAAIVASGDAKIRSLHNSVRLLNVIVSLAAASRACVVLTCSVPNAHHAASADLYLFIIYKIECNDGVSAQHLLKVFIEAPYIARKSLLPDLWDHFFLPNLLHLKIWYTKEVEIIRGWGLEDGDQ